MADGRPSLFISPTKKPSLSIGRPSLSIDSSPKGRPSLKSRLLGEIEELKTGDTPDGFKYEVLGKGGYGCVVKPTVKCRSDQKGKMGVEYVSKLYKSEIDSGSIDKFLNNLEIAKSVGREDIGLEYYRCDSPTGLRETDICSDDKLEEIFNSIAINMEEIKGNNLNEVINKNLMDFRLPLGLIKKSIIDNIETINKLHELGYGHFDIKLDNIMLVKNKDYLLHIIDYDIFTLLEECYIRISDPQRYFPLELMYLIEIYQLNFRQDIEISDMEETYRTLLRSNYKKQPEQIELIMGMNFMILKDFTERIIIGNQKLNENDMKILKSFDLYMYSRALLKFIEYLEPHYGEEFSEIKGLLQKYASKSLSERIS